ncbi:MAG: hypothetical protein V1777_03520 [Candidatus Micrarchaeota archaeon]
MQKKSPAKILFSGAQEGYLRRKTPRREQVKKAGRHLGQMELADALKRELAWVNSEIQAIQVQLDKPLDKEARDKLSNKLYSYENMGRWLSRDKVKPGIAISSEFKNLLDRKSGQWAFHFASQKAGLSREERQELKKHWAAFMKNSGSQPQTHYTVRFKLFENKVRQILKDQHRIEQYMEIFGIYNRLRKKARKEIDSLRPNRKPIGLEEEQ